MSFIETLNKKLDDRINDVNFSKTLEEKFTTYLAYTIVERALPDIRDGLKPVHRRILWAQHEMGNLYNKPYKKSARLVGDTIGKYHPHGDTAVYDSIVRMAQEFSLRLRLIDGQGNFGSIDGDNAAAMRYTEQRQSIFGNFMLHDIEKKLVPFENNYDGTEVIPEVLPTKIPNLIINGTEGIATAIATKIPTHNPIEALAVVDYMCQQEINNLPICVDKMVEIMPAPDFITGGILYGADNMKNAFLGLKAKMKLCSKWESGEEDGRQTLVITEIPYQVVKKDLVLKINDLTRPKTKDGENLPPDVEGVRAIYDRTSKQDIRIVLILEDDYDPSIIFNNLSRKTDLIKHISYNPYVLINKVPTKVGLKDIFEHFISFRKDIITKRTQYLLDKANKKQHLLTGLVLALENIDAIINIIRNSNNSQDAIENLIKSFDSLDEEQSSFIVEMKLSKLTHSQIDEVKNSLNQITIETNGYKEILSNNSKLLEIIIKENQEVIDVVKKEKTTDNYDGYDFRRTKFFSHDLSSDKGDYVKQEDSIIMLSNKGYVLRMPVDELDSQNKGTRGKRMFSIKKDDGIMQTLFVNTHKDIMLITDKGNVLTIKAYEFPIGDKPRFVNNVVEIKNEEKVIMMMEVNFDDQDSSIAMITKNGLVKKTKINDYLGSKRKGGIIGINLKDDDTIIQANLCKEEDQIFIVNSNNKITKFESSSIRNVGRNSLGVIGMRMNDGHVIGGGIVKNTENEILVIISENGLIKLTYMNEYSTINKGGKGVSAFKFNEKTGSLSKAFLIDDLENDIVVSTKKGISNRISASKLNITKRVTSGSRFIKVDEDDEIIDAFVVPFYKEEDLDECTNIVEDEEILEEFNESNFDDYE